jgi:hypothetical protein
MPSAEWLSQRRRKGHSAFKSFNDKLQGAFYGRKIYT